METATATPDPVLYEACLADRAISLRVLTTCDREAAKAAANSSARSSRSAECHLLPRHTPAVARQTPPPPDRSQKKPRSQVPLPAPAASTQRPTLEDHRRRRGRPRRNRRHRRVRGSRPRLPRPVQRRRLLPSTPHLRSHHHPLPRSVLHDHPHHGRTRRPHRPDQASTSPTGDHNPTRTRTYGRRL
jgi:hypothetical protein